MIQFSDTWSKWSEHTNSEAVIERLRAVWTKCRSDHSISRQVIEWTKSLSGFIVVQFFLSGSQMLGYSNTYPTAKIDLLNIIQVRYLDPDCIIILSVYTS
jgi:hypothetical protein